MKLPKVSVLCLTYNHVAYIKEALDSFLAQEADFEIEILIHDDCSDDGTTDILKEYQQKYPKVIQLYLEDDNQYSKGLRGFIPRFLLPHAKGEYIALCEGDDYWADPLKLQKQIDFLSKNPEFTVCFTNASTSKDGALDDYFFGSTFAHVLDGQDQFVLRDILTTNFITTCTVVYRATALSKSDEIKELPFGDWVLHVMAARSGKIKYLSEITAVYRIHDKGVWSSKPELSRNEHIFKFYDFLRTFLDKDEQALLLEVMCKKVFDYMNHATHLAEREQSLKDENASQVKIIDVAQAELSNLKEVNEHRAKKIDQLREDNILAKKIQKDAIETLQTELSHYRLIRSKWPWKIAYAIGNLLKRRDS